MVAEQPYGSSELVLHRRWHQKTTRQTNSTAISWGKQGTTKQSPVRQSAGDRPQSVPASLTFFPLAAVAAANVRVPSNLAPSGLLAFPDKCPLGGIARAAASHEKRRSFSRGWARGPGQRFRNTARRAVCRNTPCTVTRSMSGLPGIGRIHYTGRIIKQPSVCGLFCLARLSRAG